MSQATQCTDCTSFYTLGSGFTAVSDTKFIEVIKDALDEFRKNETLSRPRDEALDALEAVYSECSEANWDGYGVLPIREEAYLEAKRLIGSVPFTSFIPVPEITPEPNGTIGLEWYKGKRLVFVISISGKNEIVYAGLFGTSKVNGTEYFGDSLPLTIINNLKRLYL